MTEYHAPALLAESIEGLHIRPDGIYIDATFGGGGHSRAILEHLDEGHLFGFDQDTDAMANIPDDSRFTFVHSNFKYIRNFMRYHEIDKVDGILADLGVSSHHLDDASRGFAFRLGGDLDMRMNKSGRLTAAHIVNTYDENKLRTILKTYGEIDNANTIAKLIVSHRSESAIETIEQLKQVIAGCVPKKFEHKYLAKLFQALRMEVNQEMDVLATFLQKATELLAPGGRLVILTYHSLEDRMVKQFVKNGPNNTQAQTDVYGNSNTPLIAINKKVIIASDEEVKLNNRARSAKLRIAEKR
ncbi:MAG: hypothetical protein RIS47_2294 [Bacteroidota bacterium]|jgi:16S rRNA (cytosine1402-N4)-methyltransferase